jgi:ATP-dependent Clp protease ATP-binding subunit ClpX
MTDTDQSESVKSTTKNTLYCSFCGKSQHEVRKLIAGPTVFICDECVELCMDIVREEKRAASLGELGSVEAIAAALVSRAELGAPGNQPLKRDLALAVATRHTTTGGISGPISGLFAGPQSCGITQIIADIWAGVDAPVLSLDATQLRTTRLFDTKNVCKSLLGLADWNVERAAKGVVVIDNIDRIAKAGEEFRMIQEELELMIRGIEVPVTAGARPRPDDTLLFDTSRVSFFACTSTLHSDTTPIAAIADCGKTKYANSRVTITDALVRKGFLPELLGAFDFVTEFGSVARSELEAYLQAADSVLLVEWRNFLRQIGADLEAGWAEEVASEVQRQRTGLRGLKGILVDKI